MLLFLFSLSPEPDCKTFIVGLGLLDDVLLEVVEVDVDAVHALWCLVSVFLWAIVVHDLDNFELAVRCLLHNVRDQRRER